MAEWREDVPLASVVIPNWNGLRFLRPCLDSLRRQTYPRYEVIVVDNGSSDGSVEAARREYPQVRVIALATNTGYTGGCNAGVRAAKGDILVMLNNDTEAEPQWLSELVGTLLLHPEAGSVSSRIMIYGQPGVVNSAGDLYRRDGTPDSRGVWQQYGPPYDEETYVFGASGGAPAFRRAMLDEIGLFEEAFFMYCEDVDLAWRAQQAGWRCVYAPKAVIHHHLSATGGGVLASYYVGRNTIWVIARDYPGPLLRAHWRAVIGAQWRIAREALRAWRGASARARLRGQVAGALSCWRWLGFRRRLAQSRRADVAYLATLLA